MHEFAMAQGIFNTVYDTAVANDANEVTEIVVEIGRLAMLNPEQLKFMLGVMFVVCIVANLVSYTYGNNVIRYGLIIVGVISFVFYFRGYIVKYIKNIAKKRG